MNPHLVELNLALPDRIHTTDWLNSLKRVKQYLSLELPLFPFIQSSPTKTQIWPTSIFFEPELLLKFEPQIGKGSFRFLLLECEISFVWCECREDWRQGKGSERDNRERHFLRPSFWRLGPWPLNDGLYSGSGFVLLNQHTLHILRTGEFTLLQVQPRASRQASEKDLGLCTCSPHSLISSQAEERDSWLRKAQ